MLLVSSALGLTMALAGTAEAKGVHLPKNAKPMVTMAKSAKWKMPSQHAKKAPDLGNINVGKKPVLHEAWGVTTGIHTTTGQFFTPLLIDQQTGIKCAKKTGATCLVEAENEVQWINVNPSGSTIENQFAILPQVCGAFTNGGGYYSGARDEQDQYGNSELRSNRVCTQATITASTYIFIADPVFTAHHQSDYTVWQ
jgi:hypothetical protein